MSSYKCTFERSMYSAWVGSQLIIKPQEYLWCEDLQELDDAIWEDLRESCDTGDVKWGDSDCEHHIPEEFIKEWLKLKEG